MAKSKDALTSIDEFGSRLEIIPAEVRGFYRRWRSRIQFVLLIVFLILPWTHINGTQTILLDIVHRQFSLFGILFWSHDSPLMFFILMFIVLGIVLATALWGRIWCGWACPQTVFIDGLYRRIEILIEGNYIQRRTLRKAPASLNKSMKWIAKWGLFTVASSLIAHSFMAYFIGSKPLLTMMYGSPAENWNYFLLITLTTGALLFNFGWFREQFCIVVCPYGRFQSVLMDANSVTVLYDEKRGEPRKGTALELGQKQGDCVSCRRCVEVCPTGIDIRQGVQMECIGCTACIDACNEIMEKVNKPKDLIRYSSLYEKARFFRPRIIIYIILLIGMAAGLGFNFFNRAAFMVTVLRASETPYQVLKLENQIKILNHFKVHLHNQSLLPQRFQIILPEEFANQGIKLTTQSESLDLPAASNREVHFFIYAPQEVFNVSGNFPLNLQIQGSGEKNVVKKEIMLIGPQQSVIIKPEVEEGAK